MVYLCDDKVVVFVVDLGGWSWDESWVCEAFMILRIWSWWHQVPTHMVLILRFGGRTHEVELSLRMVRKHSSQFGKFLPGWRPCSIGLPCAWLFFGHFSNESAKKTSVSFQVNFRLVLAFPYFVGGACSHVRHLVVEFWLVFENFDFHHLGGGAKHSF